MKFTFTDSLAVVSGVTSLAAWEVQLEFGLRLIATVIAIIAGSLAIYNHLKPRKTKGSKG